MLVLVHMASLMVQVASPLALMEDMSNLFTFSKYWVIHATSANVVRTCNMVLPKRMLYLLVHKGWNTGVSAWVGLGLNG